MSTPTIVTHNCVLFFCLALFFTLVSAAAATTTESMRCGLKYGFFEEATVRKATVEELDGLLHQTVLFYSDALEAAHAGSFLGFGLSNATQTFNAKDPKYPIELDFDATVELRTNNNGVTTNDLMRTMTDADIKDYIMNYVWNAEPVETLFFETKLVLLWCKKA